MADGAPYLLMI